MGRSTQIMRGSFSQGVNSEVITFSNRLSRCSALAPVQKQWVKVKMAAFYSCIQPSDWLKRVYSSNQVKLCVVTIIIFHPSDQTYIDYPPQSFDKLNKSAKITIV